MIDFSACGLISSQCPHYSAATIFFLKEKSALAGVALWLSAGLQIKWALVGLPVRAQAWVVGQVPSSGHSRGNHTLMFLSFFLPHFPSLKINK